MLHNITMLKLSQIEERGEPLTKTLTEVAKLAGVSLATASRAFSEPNRLAPKTRDRVLAAATDLGYRAPAPAPTGTHEIGVIVPDISNAVIASQVRAMQNQLWPGRHRMILFSSDEDPGREHEFLSELAECSDGVILCSPRQSPDLILDAVGDTPLVVVNGEVDGVPSVLMEVDTGIQQAVEHLYALGHRSLTFIPGPATSWANRTRLSALTRATTHWNMRFVVLGNQAATVQGGLAAAASAAASGATAVVAYNDLVALGAQAGLRALGKPCPLEVSVVGIDGLDIAGASEPGLTTVQVANERSGLLAVELALNLINGGPTPRHAVHLDSQLIVRGSTSVARE